MTKSIIFFMLGLIIGSGGYFGAQELKQEPIIRTTLSARAKEYLGEQKKNPDDLRFKNVREEKERTGEINKRVHIDDCFSLVIPYRLKFERKDGECDYEFGFLLPRGNLKAYMRYEASTDWDSVPGVRMRRQSSHTYQEAAVQANGKQFLTFKNKESGLYEQNAFYRTPAYFIVVNVSMRTSGDVGTQFKQILESIEIK